MCLNVMEGKRNLIACEIFFEARLPCPIRVARLAESRALGLALRLQMPWKRRSTGGIRVRMKSYSCLYGGFFESRGLLPLLSTPHK